MSLDLWNRRLFARMVSLRSRDIFLETYHRLIGMYFLAPELVHMVRKDVPTIR